MQVVNKILNYSRPYKERQAYKGEENISLTPDNQNPSQDKESYFDRKSDEFERYFSFLKEDKDNQNKSEKANNNSEKDDFYKYIKSYNKLQKEQEKEEKFPKIDVIA